MRPKKLNAVSAPPSARWDIPSSAMERWLPFAADESATLSIFEGIGEQWDGSGMTAARVAGILRANKGKDITVSINSPGGDFFEGVAIYNLLREHEQQVTVKVVGLAASAASIIAMAGDVVKMAPSAFLMIHNAWAVVMGNKHDLAEAIEVLSPFDQAMAEVYAQRSGMTVKEAAKMMDNDTWISGSQAVELGLADSLTEDPKKPEPEDSKRKAALENIVAVRSVEIALAKQGIPRAQREEILKEVSAPRDASGNANADTPRDASGGELEVLKSFANFFKEKQHA